MLSAVVGVQSFRVTGSYHTSSAFLARANEAERQVAVKQKGTAASAAAARQAPAAAAAVPAAVR